MKLLTYKVNESSQPSLGVVIDDDYILDLNKASNGTLYKSMIEFIEAGNEALKITSDLICGAAQELIPLKDVIILPPIPNPPSLKDAFAFEDHAKNGSKRAGLELSPHWYEVPAYYKGNHREIYGPGDVIPWPSYTRKLDFECEIACVIGKKGRDLSVEEAKEHIFGYMIFNDASARDIQKYEMGLRLGPAKGKDFANVFGPYLVTRDEVNPKEDFSLKIRVNGEQWSEGHFKDQYWEFPLLISHISQSETVYPGDIIGSGTFYKGCGLDLDRWIQPGDSLELEVGKLGILKNKVGKPDGEKQLIYKREAKAGS